MQYYYLVSSLPEIRLDSDKPPMELKEFEDRSAESLSPEHIELLNILKYRADNINLISILNGDGKFLQGGCFSAEELEDGVKSLSGIAPYMIEFLGSGRGPGVMPEDSLWEYYLAYIKGRNEFLEAYFGFEKNLRNILTALNFKNLGRPFEEKLSGADDYAAAALLHSSAADFGFGGEFPFIDRLAELVKSRKFYELERYTASLKFEEIESLLKNHYFTAERVLGYYLELETVWRFGLLDAKAGAARLDELSKKDVGDEALYEFV